MAPPLPQIVTEGTRHRLLVDGAPYVILGAQVRNSSTSPDDLSRVWPQAVELNANPARLDLNVEHLRMAQERGVLVSISADAHSVRELDHLAHGVAVARRAGLAAEDVLNARTLPELRAWVAARRA